MALYISDEEYRLAEMSVLLPLVRKVVELNMKKMNGFKLPRPYLALSEKLCTDISNDLRDVKKELYRKKIKIVEISKNEITTEWEIHCRGYVEKMGFMHQALRDRVEEILHSYLMEKPTSEEMGCFLYAYVISWFLIRSCLL